MAERGRFAFAPQLDINQILVEAQQRWLRPAEICEILRNYRTFRIAPEPPNKPSSGSLFLFDRKVLRYFRKDGHNWRKKKDGKTVREAHERLKAGSVDVLHCYYAHGEDNENFQRRSYWMLEEDYMHIVLVHYREVKSSKASYIRTREAEGTALVSHANSPSCSSSYTNQSRPPSQMTDASSSFSAQTSEYEDAESDNYQASSGYHTLPEMQQYDASDNYQASSGYHALLEMQQYGNRPVTHTHFLNPHAPIRSINNQYDHQRIPATGSRSDYYSIPQEDVTRVFDETGIELTLSGSRTPVGLTSWEEVFEHCSEEFQRTPFDPTIAPTRDAMLDHSNQDVLTVGGNFTNGLGFKQDDIANAQGKSVWQPGDAAVGSLVSDLDEGVVDLSTERNLAYTSLLKQLSLELSNPEGEGLKKYDSFSRWMSSELGEVDVSHLKSTSEVYWSTVGGESVDDAGISNQEQLDTYLVSPSISQEQLFSIIEFSPNCACTDQETKVKIAGKFLMNKVDVKNFKWSCMFGEIEVPADIIGDGTLCCYAPPHRAGRVPFYITCSNRSACSEVREFEYQEQLNQYSNGINEMDLRLRLDTLLSLGSANHPQLAIGMSSDKENLINEINLLMGEVDDEWFNALKSMQEDFSNSAQDCLPDKLLKDKLHIWLIDKVVEDGKGPNVLDEEGQGVIHLAAALGYDWAIKPTITSGVSVNFRDVHGWTALHWAAYCGRERTVATLIRLVAAAGALTDPTPEFPSGRTAADLASSSGHKGIAGFVAESSLTSHLRTLNLKDSKCGDLSEVSDVTGIEDITASDFYGDKQAGLSLKDSLSAVRKATQAAARIHQVFRVESFQRKKLIEYDDDKCGISDERALSLVSLKAAKTGHQDLPVHAAAIKIQNKFRGWKGRKEFLYIRQRIVKIQAHVRGHQVRKHYKKIVWTVGIVEKVILRWRRKGSGLRGFRSEGLIESTSMQNQPAKEDDYDFLKEGRKQTEVRLEKALARVKSMVQYPEAREQYSRLMTVVNELEESKVAIMEDVEESADGNFMTGLEELWDDDNFMPAL